MSNIPIDVDDIEVPPFPSSEEEDKKDPIKKKGKGYLSILEEVFPIVTSSVKNADVTKEIMAIDLRFDLSVINHNVNQLNKIHLLLKKYKIEDVTDLKGPKD